MFQSTNLRGILAMLASAVTFVSCDCFLKLIMGEGVPPLQALVLRGISATAWAAGLVTLMGLWRDLPKAFGFWVMLRSLFEVVAVSAFIVGLANVPLADITSIYQIAPLLVIAGASMLWGEKVGLVRWLLIALGLAGAMLVAQPGSAGASPYALLGFITAFASAGRDLLSRFVPDNTPGMINTFNIVVAVMLASLINTSLFETWTPVTVEIAFYAFFSGMFVMLGHLFVFWSFRFATARTVAPFYYSVTLVAATFGAVFFNEWPNALALLGIALIVTCGLGVLLFERKGSPVPGPESVDAL
jgi:drug/metabolite transporter (DMT)-like permease